MNLTPPHDKHSTTQLAKVLPSHPLRVMEIQPKIGNNSNLAYGTSVDLSPTFNRKTILTSFPLDVVFRDQYHLAGRGGSHRNTALP
jgi:hypothetical protein